MLARSPPWCWWLASSAPSWPPSPAWWPGGQGGGRRWPRAAEHAGEELFRARAARFLRRRLDPEAATGLALTIALGLVFAAALGFGLVSDMVTSETGLYRLDASAAAWGADNATPASTWFLGAVTWLGATVTVLAVTFALGGLEWLRRRRLAVLAFMVTVVVGQNLIVNTVKVLVDRERPPVPHLAPSSGFSFPSGHTAAAAATWAAVVLVLGRGRPVRTKAWLAAGAAAVAVAVAASRVLLGVHWLTDVIGGAALGLRLVRGLRGRLRRRPAPLRRPGRAGRGRGG